ncbi:MAG TPA: FHA domain-containing protein [Polyangiaceae bacterium]|nr:FHA domain-containing protein [Polyangiaceae bacterium]
MTAPRALPNLGPRHLVEDAATLDLIEFLTRHGDAQLLLVRIPEDDTELELGLVAGASSAGAGVPEPLPFRTGLQAPPRAWRSDSEKTRREDPAALLRLVEKHPHVAVPVRKRGDSDALFMGRISIGRARNKDIVLRHPSISKFHAWFEVDASENLHVCDAGSTNLTHLNGKPLEARARTAVEPGDALRFGFIETVVCSPGTFWACLDLHKAG